MPSRFGLELATTSYINRYIAFTNDINMVNLSILRRTQVVMGRVVTTLYSYMGIWVDNEAVHGWVEVLCIIFDTTPLEQGPVQHRYLVKDLEYAIIYHFHRVRGQRLRFYNAQIKEDGEIAIDDRENAIHAPANNINGQPRPLMRGFAIPSSWYIILKADGYPDIIAIKYYYEPTSSRHTVLLDSSSMTAGALRVAIFQQGFPELATFYEDKYMDAVQIYTTKGYVHQDARMWNQAEAESNADRLPRPGRLDNHRYLYYYPYKPEEHVGADHYYVRVIDTIGEY